MFLSIPAKQDFWYRWSTVQLGAVCRQVAADLKIIRKHKDISCQEILISTFPLWPKTQPFNDKWFEYSQKKSGISCSWVHTSIMIWVCVCGSMPALFCVQEQTVILAAYIPLLSQWLENQKKVLCVMIQKKKQEDFSQWQIEFMMVLCRIGILKLVAQSLLLPWFNDGSRLCCSLFLDFFWRSGMLEYWICSCVLGHWFGCSFWPGTPLNSPW